jgi:hypothetical protein
MENVATLLYNCPAVDDVNCGKQDALLLDYINQLHQLRVELLSPLEQKLLDALWARLEKITTPKKQDKVAALMRSHLGKK